MTGIIDGFAGFGLLCLLVLIYAGTRAVIKLRAANVRLATIRNGYSAAAGDRSAGEAAVPSAYTIPKGPAT